MVSRRLKPDAGAYSALILAHVRAGHWRAALQVFPQNPENLTSLKETYDVSCLRLTNKLRYKSLAIPPLQSTKKPYPLELPVSKYRKAVHASAGIQHQ